MPRLRAFAYPDHETDQVRRRGMQGLWDFACEIYGRDGVSGACLALQDRAGVDVLVLLHAIWRVQNCGQTVGPEDVAAADALVAEWRGRIVAPLRALRRDLKSGPSPAPSQATEALRQTIKKAELNAERIQLDLLEASSVPRAGDRLSAQALGDTIGHVLHHYAAAPPPEAIAAAAALKAALSPG